MWGRFLLLSSVSLTPGSTAAQEVGGGGCQWNLGLLCWSRRGTLCRFMPGRLAGRGRKRVRSFSLLSGECWCSVLPQGIRAGRWVVLFYLFIYLFIHTRLEPVG